MECKECIFGNHERKTCYLESSCEEMHEWLREHDKEVRNKAIDDLTAELIKHISNVPSKRIGGGNVFVVADNLKQLN